MMKFFLFIVVLFMWFPQIASSHDIFRNLQSETGSSCCSDGDCERIKADQVVYKQNVVYIRSKRLQVVVMVPMERIQWAVPVSLEPENIGVWCGNPRQPDRPGSLIPLTRRQPDEKTLTFCLFLNPGGV
jgi:hypothetical protein